MITDFTLHNTIFVVDDEKVNRAVLSGLIRRLGFACMEYESGREALTAFERLRQAGRRIAAIIMDINMPEMDGLETVWRIRVFEAQQQHNCSCQDAVVPPSALRDQRDPGSSTPHTRLSSQSDCLSGHGGCERCKATPVWAVSASSLQEQSKSPAMQLISPSHRGRGGPPWKLAGFDAFVPKPLQYVQLANLLSSRQSEGSTSFSEDTAPTGQEKLKLPTSPSEAASALTSLPTCSLDACTALKRERAGPDTPDVCQTDAEAVPHICTPAN